MSDDPIVLETAEGCNGFKRWRLLLRPHGFFLFEEMTLQDEIYHVDDEGVQGAIVAEAYWMPTHVSGLFDTQTAAREDALATLPWLREAITTGSYGWGDDWRTGMTDDDILSRLFVLNQMRSDSF